MPQLQEREKGFVEKGHLVNQYFSNPNEPAGDRVNMADPDSEVQGGGSAFQM